MNIKEDYNLRENADIVHLAMKASKSLDSTELKQWFDKKYDKPQMESMVWGMLIGVVLSMCVFTIVDTLNQPKDYYETDISKTTIKAHKH